MAPHRLKLLGACLVSFLLAGMGHLESPSWPASCTSVAFSLVHLGPWLGLCSLAVSAASAPSSASSSSPSARRFTASSLPRVSSGSAAVCQPSRGFPPWPPADASASWPLDTPCGEHSRRTCCSLGQARRIGVKVAEAFPEQYMASAPPQQPFSSSRSAASVQASAQPPLRVGEAVVHDTVPSSPSSPSSASALRLSSAGHRCMEATAHVWCADCDGGVGVGGFSGGSSRDRVVLSYSFCNWWWAACRSAYWSTSSRGSVTAITPCTPKALACARARDIVANAREFCLVGGYDVAEPTPVERQAAALNRDKRACGPVWIRTARAVRRSITNDSQISRLLIICVGLVIMFIVLFNRKRSAYTKMNEAQRPASDADLRARAAELRAHYHMLYNQQRPPVLKHPNTRETFDSVPYTPEAFAEHCPDC
eukprot:GHVT01055934.1.p1 GENE.GHVT01055934.1~~GHVT01055934.1.p1  ORF type:complete len:424 (-),score=80.66 GHVT01055934.1:1130-2401(-)